jgi:hypothetical protein
LAAGVNLPAVALAALSLAPFDDRLRTGASRDLAMHVATAIYIPLLWFLIGKRLDRRRTIRAAPLSKRRKGLALVALAGLILAASLMLCYGSSRRASVIR